jgi:hypothetical protein
LTALIEGRSAAVAWIECVSANCTAKSAREQASRRVKRPEVRARLRWLLRQRQLVASARGEAPAGGEASGGRGEALDKAGLVKELERMIRSATTPQSIKLGAIDKLAKLKRYLVDEDRPPAPDPSWLAEYLRESELRGEDPVARARSEAGEDEDQAVPGDAGLDVPDGVEVQDVVVSGVEKSAAESADAESPVFIEDQSNDYTP